MKIALLHEVSSQADEVRCILAKEALECIPVTTVGEVLQKHRRDPFHLVIVRGKQERGLPALIWTLRENLRDTVPIFCLVRPFDEEAIAAILAAGANGYALEPIRRTDLIVRTRVLLRQAYPSSFEEERLHFGSYAFEPKRKRITIAGEPVAVTNVEFDLALLLFRHLGQPLSRAFIMEQVWGMDPGQHSRTLDTHMSRVRTKLRLLPAQGFRLATVYGYGYQLTQTTSGDNARDDAADSAPDTGR